MWQSSMAMMSFDVAPLDEGRDQQPGRVRDESGHINGDGKSKTTTIKKSSSTPSLSTPSLSTLTTEKLELEKTTEQPMDMSRVSHSHDAQAHPADPSRVTDELTSASGVTINSSKSASTSYSREAVRGPLMQTAKAEAQDAVEWTTSDDSTSRPSVSFGDISHSLSSLSSHHSQQPQQKQQNQQNQQEPFLASALEESTVRGPIEEGRLQEGPWRDSAILLSSPGTTTATASTIASSTFSNSRLNANLDKASSIPTRKLSVQETLTVLKAKVGAMRREIDDGWAARLTAMRIELDEMWSALDSVADSSTSD